MAETSTFVRPSRDHQMMQMVKLLAQRGECRRRQVGCVIVDFRGRILSTGYNGQAPGRIPCVTIACEGADSPSGTDLDLCRASHAEISALVTLEKPFEAHTLYCTTEPCVQCVKAILLTSIERVVFETPYPAGGREVWGRPRWEHYNGEDIIQTGC